MGESSIQENYKHVLKKIGLAAQKAGRDLETIKLVVVTKGHPATAVEKIIEAGANILGENYVEEAVHKIQTFPDWTGEWHMIGHIQSRKAKDVVAFFDYVHSLDSLKLAKRLDRFAKEKNKVVPVLLECNLSGEKTKFGWDTWEQSGWSRMLSDVEQILMLENIQVNGVMTMPPFPEYPEQSRPYFQKLCGLREYLAEHFPESNWHELSMGMSGDYEVAIEEGATMLRIGTAIMGPRLKNV